MVALSWVPNLSTPFSFHSSNIFSFYFFITPCFPFLLVFWGVVVLFCFVLLPLPFTCSYFPFQWLRSVYDQKFKFNHTCDHHNNSISTVFYIIHVWEWQKWSRQLIHSDGSDKEAVIISANWHFLSQSLPTGSSGNGSILHKVVFEDKTPPS